MTEVVDTNKIHIRLINTNTASLIIKEKHYTHNLNLGGIKYCFGIYYESDNNHQFFSGLEEKLIGTIIFGRPVGRNVAKSISSYLKKKQVLELIRLFIDDGYGKNIESYVIGKTLRWIKGNDSTVKAVISFSDPEQGHNGIVYQASNFYYLGMTGSDFLYKLGENQSWVHGRTVTSSYSTRNITNLARILGHDFYLKSTPAKHRYLYITADRREKRIILNTLKYDRLEYPKSDDPVVAEVLCVKVKNRKVEDIEKIESDI